MRPLKPACDVASRHTSSGTLTLSNWRTKASRWSSSSASSDTPTSASQASTSKASTAARSSAPSTDDHRRRSRPARACRSDGREQASGRACRPVRPNTSGWRLARRTSSPCRDLHLRRRVCGGASAIVVVAPSVRTGQSPSPGLSQPKLLLLTQSSSRRFGAPPRSKQPRAQRGPWLLLAHGKQTAS